MAEETRDFLLPDLGEGLTDAEIVQWLVKPGDAVDLNQPIVEVETEKALVEIPSPFAGTVEAVYGDVGERVNVGSKLITVKTAAGAPQTGRKEVLVGYGPEEGASKRRKQRKIGRRGAEAEPEPQQPAATSRAQAPTLTSVPAAPTQQQEAARPAKALATPPVRKLARDLGVDIDSVRGSGPDGRVTREDVMAASEAPASAGSEADIVRLAPAQRIARADAPEEERIPVRSIRRSIAERMVKSKFTIPHVTEWLQVDATEMMKLRADLQQAPEAGTKISPLPVIVKALIAALRAHPIINSTYDAERNEMVVRRVYHIGIATDTERGLLVPVVRDADQLNVFQLADEIARLAAAARDGSIGPQELGGSTITVTNIGSFGMESGTPIINYPEAAILAPGAIAKRPWVVDGQLAIRDVMTLALAFDHRIIDGAAAGRFLRYLADLIEKPARLFGVL